MSIDYNEKIKLLNGENGIDSIHYISELPDSCPICTYYISPSYIMLYDKDGQTSEVLCGCPRNDCGSLFIAIYSSKNSGGNWFELTKCYPYTKFEKSFPDEIYEISHEFVDIYNQADHAEQEGLHLICGGAYRKALEYLIKDFASHLYPDDTERINSMPLQRCVQNFVEQVDIKDMAERAIWLGNDETHYIRKWEDKDINDLKNLIDLTVYYISMNIKAKKYREDMAR